MDVTSMTKLFDKLRSHDLEVQQQRCVVVRNRNVVCKRCAQACTSGCIGVEDGHLVFEPENCIGCGTCATACPAGALEPRMPADGELFAACSKALEAAGGAAVISCEQRLEAMRGRYDAEKLVGVNCLGRVDESLLARLAAVGAQRIYLCHSACDACSRSCGGEMARAVVESAQALFAAYGCETRITLADGLPSLTRLADGAGYNADKRAFFSTLKSEMRFAAGAAVDLAEDEAAAAAGAAEAGEEADPPVVQVMRDGTLPHFIPARRRELLEWVRAAGPAQQETLESRLWGCAEIDVDACASCRMCSTFCPTGALQRFDEEDGTFGLLHAPGLCVVCRACEDICPENAIRISQEVPTAELLAGYVRRFELEPLAVVKGDAHSIVNNMRNIIGTSAIYER